MGLGEPTPVNFRSSSEMDFPRNSPAPDHNVKSVPSDGELLAKAFVSLSIAIWIFLFLAAKAKLGFYHKKTYADDDFIIGNEQGLEVLEVVAIYRSNSITNTDPVDDQKMIMTPMSIKKRHLM